MVTSSNVNLYFYEAFPYDVVIEILNKFKGNEGRIIFVLFICFKSKKYFYCTFSKLGISKLSKKYNKQFKFFKQI